MARKLSPRVRVDGEKAQISIPFHPIRSQTFRVQWHGREHIDEKGVEFEETIDRPLPQSWDLWCQADVIAKAVRDRGGQPSPRKVLVVGKDESLRVLGWLDDAREMAGIEYASEVEAV